MKYVSHDLLRHDVMNHNLGDLATNIMDSFVGHILPP